MGWAVYSSMNQRTASANATTSHVMRLTAPSMN
jgi:hypothetical protein